MTFMELAKSRYSVRSYQDKPVEAEKLQKILEAGRVAPTACNNQPQKIYVAQSEAIRQQLGAVCRCTFQAPVILAVCYDEDRIWHNPLTTDRDSGHTDAAIVCTHMMLQAAELGLGSCWVGWFDEEKIAQVLGLPENITVSALLPIGYAAEDYKPHNNHTKFRTWDDTIVTL